MRRALQQAHFQNVLEMSSPVQLQQEMGWVEGQVWWEAAAAKVLADPIAWSMGGQSQQVVRHRNAVLELRIRWATQLKYQNGHCQIAIVHPSLENLCVGG